MKTPTFPLTDAEYRRTPGMCPFCGGENITGESVDINSYAAYQEINCADCEETWFDVYELQGYERIKRTDENV